MWMTKAHPTFKNSTGSYGEKKKKKSRSRLKDMNRTRDCMNTEKGGHCGMPLIIYMYVVECQEPINFPFPY